MASVAEGVNIIVHTNVGANPYLRAICKSIVLMALLNLLSHVQ